MTDMLREMRIPVWGRKGEVRRWTLVDPIDYEWAQQFRWYIMGGREGYASRSTTRDGVKTTVAMHTEILHRMGLSPDPLCDHKNRDHYDNRRENLRPASYKLNANNRRPDAKKRGPVLPEPSPRACKACGQTFIPRRKSPGRVYCSVACQRSVALAKTSESQAAKSRIRWSKIHESE